jgi:PKHD-type hydroxylase
MENKTIMLPGSYLHIPALLSPEMLRRADELIATCTFVDGKATATGAAREIKQNLQAKPEGSSLQEVQAMIMQAVSAHPMTQAGVMPKFIVPPVIGKYEPGMSYGWHTDSPVMMGSSHPLRVDVSMTLFLSDPSAYDGGELVIHNGSGYSTYKLNRGDAIIYPTTRLHAVNEVTSGTRLVAVTWMQSSVKDAAHRELLFQLKYVQESIARQNLQSMENLLLMQVHSNLLRMWTEM